MNSFAFMIHPLDPKRDVARKYPFLSRILPEALIHFFSRFWPPVYLSHITGIRSEATGEEIEGWLIACPFTVRQMLRLPPSTVYRKIIQTGRLAQRLGAQILGLGAFTSAIGDGGMTVAHHLDIPVTTGHSLTVAAAVEGAREALSHNRIEPRLSTAAVIGATGSIGSACAELLAPQVERMILVSRQRSRLSQVQMQVEAAGAKHVSVSTEIAEIRQAHLVLSASNTTHAIIHPEHLRQGAVVCDVALPPDVSPRVAEERDDVVIVPGGVMDVPGDPDMGFDFGLPDNKVYACMAETMILAMEGCYESFSLGKYIQREKAERIDRLARKHGFLVQAIER